MTGTVVVTGGGSGIGRATVETLAALGFTPIVVDVNPDAAAAVAESTCGKALVADLADGCEELIQAVIAATDSLSGLVNCAGIFRGGPLVEQTPDTIDMVWRVNLRAPMLLSIGLLPLLERGGGSIVNVASISGLHPHAGSGMYGPSKAGLISFTQQCALEFAAHGVRANAVCPGLVRTPLTEFQYVDPKIHSLRQSAVPLRRISAAQDSADAIAFLLSAQASYITGVALEVDGGISKSLMTHFP